MPVSFENITVGQMYTRPELARLWEYESHQALARGVVTPKNDNKIILFVTEEKQSYQEQYRDELHGDTLYWEGPTDHFAEERMIHVTETRDEIHVFHRKRHHTPFRYLGCATVGKVTRNAIKPSRFELILDEGRAGVDPPINRVSKPVIQPSPVEKVTGNESKTPQGQNPTGMDNISDDPNQAASPQESVRTRVWERCKWLGITEPSQIEILTVLAAEPDMIGDAEKVLSEAAARIGLSVKDEALSRIRKAVVDLISLSLIKLIERTSNYLYFLNRIFWEGDIAQLKLQNFAIHVVLKDFTSNPPKQKSFIPEVKRFLREGFGVLSTNESILLLLRCLSKKDQINCIQLVDGDIKRPIFCQVVWNGNIENLVDKINSLSRSILGSVFYPEGEKTDNQYAKLRIGSFDSYSQQEDREEEPAEYIVSSAVQSNIPDKNALYVTYPNPPDSESMIPVRAKVEILLKGQNKALHYREIEQKILEEYGTRHYANAILNSSPNIIRLLPGVFIHKDNYDEVFSERFGIEQAAILDLTKEEVEESSEPVSIETLSHILYDSEKLRTLSLMAIASAISTVVQTDTDFLIIPTPGNPKTRSLVRKSIYFSKNGLTVDTNSYGYANSSTLSVPDRKKDAHILAEKQRETADGETLSEPQSGIDLDRLLKTDRPQEHIQMQTWNSWRTQLKGKAVSHTRVSDIARQLDLEWPYTRREEILSEYLDFDLNQLTELVGFGPKKLRTLVLCVAHCDSLEKGFLNHKGSEYEKPVIVTQPTDYDDSYLSEKLESEREESTTHSSTGYEEIREDLLVQAKREKYELAELVAKSNLSVRARNTILNNVCSVEGLENLTYPKLLSFKNSGRKTASDIMALIKELRANDPSLANSEQPRISSEEKIKTTLSSAPTSEGLNALPFFIGKRLAFLSQDDLHPGYRATLKLSDVPMSVRTAKVLRQIGYDRLAQVLLTPRFELLRQNNFGLKSLKELHAIVTNLILPEKADAKGHEIDYSSFSSMIRTWLDSCKIRTREQEIIVMWLSSIENNRVTLQDIADKYSLSRERVRQIIDKAFRKVRHPVHSKKLRPFWNKIDEVVDSGGGVIGLPQLAQTIGKELQWDRPPGPTSLKRLVTQCGLTHLYIDKEAATIALESCNCLTCSVPVETLSKIFSEPNSGRMNIWVVCKKLVDICEKECVHRSTRVTAFHRAFLEMAIDKTAGTCVLQDDLVFPKYDWDIQYGPNLSSVAYTLLQEHGSPLHFSELATIIREKSERFKDVSDAYVHGALLNDENIQIVDRGTYGLTSWDVPEYQPVSKAIERLFEHTDLPMRREEIIFHLREEYKEENISAALGYPAFHRIGEGYYDLSERWDIRRHEDFIGLLPNPLSSFATYIVANSNLSYKLVMALVFIRGMDENGSIYLQILKDRFLNYYLSRQKRGQIVEKDSSILRRLDDLEFVEIRSRASKEPLKSFINSGYFFQRLTAICLREDLVVLLRDNIIKKILMLTILKGIEEYFDQIGSKEAYSHKFFEDAPTAKEGSILFAEVIAEDTQHELLLTGSSIGIKQKGKEKIRL